MKHSQNIILPLFLAFLLVLFASPLFSQTCIPVFKKEYGGTGNDEALNVLYTNDKGSIVVGRTTSASKGNYDGFILKLTESGAVEWSRNYGGSQFDELNRIKATRDGGYIALGQTNSFGNPYGDPFIVKINASGNVLWAKKYTGNLAGKNRATDVIELSDGNYVLLINRNDSTASGDALVVKLSGTGNPLWSKSFDNGKGDGFNAITEEADSLVLAGHSYLEKKYGTLTKISQADGHIFWAKKLTRNLSYDRTLFYNCEVLSVEALPGGLAFSTQTSLSKDAKGNANAYLTEIKMLNSGAVTYEILHWTSTGSGYTIESLSSRTTPDGGFVSLVNDTTPHGNPVMSKLGPGGQTEMGRSFSKYDFYGRIKGLDLTGDHGYLLAGYRKPTTYGTVFNKIHLVKTDILGLTGECSSPMGGNHLDTVHHIITPMAWDRIQDQAGATFTDIALAEAPNGFAVTSVLCEQTSCEDAATPSYTCNPEFLVHLKGNGLTDAYDVEKTADGGYLVAGRYQYYGSEQPLLTKLQADGSVAWSASYYQYLHDGYFKKIVPAGDGNFLVIGVNAIVLNHGVSVFTTLLKVDITGKVLWCKRHPGEVKAYDAVATEDGGFILCANSNYGSPPLYSYLMRIDKDGNLVWKRQVHHFVFNPVYKCLYLEGNDLYVGADYYLEDNHFRLERWDATTGKMIWDRRWKTDEGEVLLNGIAKKGDTLSVMISLFIRTSIITYKKAAAVVKVNTKGDLLDTYKLSAPNFTNTANGYYRNEFEPIEMVATDSSFIVAQQAEVNSGKVLNITNFRPDGTLIWSKNYDNLNSHYVWSLKKDNDHLLIAGRLSLTDFTDYRQDKSFIMRVDRDGNIREGALGKCHNVPGDIAKTGFVIQSFRSEVDSVTSPKYITLTDFQPVTRPVKVFSTLSCNTPSLCTAPEIQGVDTICDAGNSYQFRLIRNAGCTAPSLWTLDTSRVRVEKETDSTLTVTFIRSGPTSLTARLVAGCSLLSSEKEVFVVPRASTLSLGGDTVLCPGNTLLLNAGKGFASYKWQDGSPDPAYTVTRPGKYYVTVQDACGGIFTDTLHVKEAPPLTIDLGPALSKCNDDPLTITAPAGFIRYSWSPAYAISAPEGQSITVRPATDTTYRVMAEKTPGCFAYGSVSVTVRRSPAIDLGSDTSFCQGGSMVLNAGNGFGRYQWNTGAAEQSLTVRSAGTYSVAATTEEGCTSYDTLRILAVFANPVVLLNKDTALCMGSTRTLDAGAGYKNYLWNDGSRNRTLPVKNTGFYSVQVTDNNGCTGTDSATITRMLPLPSGFLPPDTSICSYSTLSVGPTASFDHYLWNTGAVSKGITISRAGTYWLQVSDRFDCTGRDTIIVTPKECMEGFYIPNAFTPNKDGRNDFFKPLIFGKVKKLQFTVFNRYGEAVFSTTELNKGWDGRYKGLEQRSNIFVWTCTYQLEGKELTSQKGTVVLIN